MIEKTFQLDNNLCPLPQALAEGLDLDRQLGMPRVGLASPLRPLLWKGRKRALKLIALTLITPTIPISQHQVLLTGGQSQLSVLKVLAGRVRGAQLSWEGHGHRAHESPSRSQMGTEWRCHCQMATGLE